MPCGRLGTSELLLIFLLVALLFGATRLPEIGRGLGLGIRRFRKALHEDEEGPSDGKKRKQLQDDE
ncbi:MAG TPA: twin-arginine translocase TatA/TatE family subunit [Candidatus Krumholzibacteria bacterium]|nr:twin-arginine translocase TatA/TatE family subunit [Candidatus Krumholzibacteria bacterium]